MYFFIYGYLRFNFISYFYILWWFIFYRVITLLQMRMSLSSKGTFTRVSTLDTEYRFWTGWTLVRWPVRSSTCTFLDRFLCERGTVHRHCTYNSSNKGLLFKFCRQVNPDDKVVYLRTLLVISSAMTWLKMQ